MVTKAPKATVNGTTANRIADALDAPPTMKPKIVQFLIVGTAPLLQNNPALFILADTGSEALGTKKTYKPEDEAEKRTYKDADGHFCHPTDSFKRAVMKAVTGKKFGKVSAPSAIRSAVFVPESLSIIEGDDGNPAAKYEIDGRSVVNPGNKARVYRSRPVWPKWRMRVALEIDTAILTPEHVRDALNLAGRTVGVGDFRPEKGGGFGRFTAEIID